MQQVTLGKNVQSRRSSLSWPSPVFVLCLFGFIFSKSQLFNSSSLFSSPLSVTLWHFILESELRYLLGVILLTEIDPFKQVVDKMGFWNWNFSQKTDVYFLSSLLLT